MTDIDVTIEQQPDINVTIEAAPGVNNFLQLIDTPSIYTGQTGKVATVNATEDALEFSVPGAIWGGLTGTLSDQTDLQAALDLKEEDLTFSTGLTRVGDTITINDGEIVHQSLSGAGTNTHAQIDSHISDASNPHTTTISNLNDSVITTVGDQDILAYDNSTSKWINQTALEAGLATDSDLTTHTGDSTIHYTQSAISIPASQISDFDTEVSNNTNVASNTTHRNSDGKNHSDVVLNNTHRGVTTGNPHSVSLSDVGGTTDHTELSNIGTNSHTDVDSHISNITTNPHSVDKIDVGLSNVPNTDCTNASNISTGTLASSVLPPVALTTVQVAASEVAMLALTTEEGDVVVRSDENKSYMRNSGIVGDMTDFTELQTPTDSVLSVNGETGTVVLTTGDISEDADSNYVSDAQLTVIGNTTGTNTGDQSSGDFDHTGLQNIGTNTHVQIDSHISNVSNPHSVEATQISDFDTEVTNNTDVGLNTTHRSSDGKNHSDVVLNNTHRGSDGKNHSDVVLNNTHRGSDGSDHTYIDQNITSGSSPTFDGTNMTGIDYENVEIATLGTPTYDNVKDFINIAQSTGKISGWVVSDGGSGTLDITAGSGYIRPIDSQVGEIISFNLGPTSGLSLIDNSNNWIYVDYNGGSPQFGATADLANVDFNTKILIGQAYRTGLTVVAIDAGPVAYDVAYRTARRAFEIYRVSRCCGLILGEEGTRNMSMTLGSAYYGTTRQTYTALNTSISDTFTSHYHTGGSWTTSAGQTQIDNVYYDDGTNLTEVGVAKFGVHWVYLGFDDTLHVVYGTDSYSLIEAEASQEPSTSDFVSTFAFLIGRIIILKNASSFTETSSAFTTTFTKQIASNHSELSNLQGGTINEYYHLTNAELSSLSNIGDATSIQGITVDDTDIDNNKILVYNSTSGNLEYEAQGSAPVTSVFTRTGDIVSAVGDYTAAQVTNAFDTSSDTMDDITNGATYVKSENNFTDTLKTKLDGVEDSADVNNISDVNATDLTDASDTSLHYHTADRNRTNHTGTQAASTISDFGTEVANNTAVAANTAKETNATHTGDVTGSTILTIGSDKVLDSMINWGTGATQVNTADIPELTNLYYTEARVNANTNVSANTTHRSSDGKNHSDVVANNAKVTNATHIGEVTGSGALTITDNIIDEANLKLDSGPTNDYVLTADSGESGGMKWAEAAAGGITWNEITGTSQGAVVDNGYIANNAGLVTVTLPDTATLGSTLRIAGLGAGGWKLAQNASEYIYFGNSTTTTGTGGSLASTHTKDAIELVCVVANTGWSVISSVGNIDIV